MHTSLRRVLTKSQIRCFHWNKVLRKQLFKSLPKTVSADEAAQYVKSGDCIFIQTGVQAPQVILDAIVKRNAELTNVNFIGLHSSGSCAYLNPDYFKSFHTNAMFFGKNERVNYNAGMKIGKCSVDYVPMFLGDIPRFIERDGVPIDIALIMVSPPDKHGWCRLGVNIDITPPALEKAKMIIAQVNDCVPRTHGTAIHISEIDAIVPHNHPLIEEPAVETTEVDDKIGKIIAELIPDGACLQMGIGAIPNAVLKALENHKDLGIHTEMFSDGLIPLVEKGVVTCKKKTLDKGKIVTAFVKGSKKSYDFVDDNPFVQFKSSLYVNDPFIIAQQEKMMSINSAIEIDLTGQICADSIGTRFYSGVGGQVDFMYGAARSLGGKPITALPSVTAKGESKIVPTLKLGAGVVTTRAHAHWVVTEWGAVNLHGKNLRQRAMAMISIAHPDHREALYKAAIERFSHCGDYGNSNCICSGTEH